MFRNSSCGLGFTVSITPSIPINRTKVIRKQRRGESTPLENIDTSPQNVIISSQGKRTNNNRKWCQLFLSIFWQILRLESALSIVWRINQGCRKVKGSIFLVWVQENRKRFFWVFIEYCSYSFQQEKRIFVWLKILARRDSYGCNV